MAEKTPKKKVASKSEAAPKKKVAKKAVSSPKQTPEVAKTEAPKKKAAKEQTFENDLVKVKLEISEACQASLHVEVSTKAIQEAHNQALKEVGKSISIPGFRKGKVPKNLIEKNYGPNIRQERTQILLQKAIDEGLSLANVRPLNYRQIKPKVEKHTEDSATFSYTFESYPDIPEIPLDKIKVPKVEAEEVTHERAQEVIDVMRSYRAKWTPVEDRAAKMGDYVDIDILNLEDDSKLVAQKRVEVQKGKLSKWLIDLIVGMKKDESKEGTSEWDAKLASGDKKDFKPTHCKVTVLGIFEGELPPVDDEFAKAMGTQSVAELNTQVHLRLTKNAEQAAETRQKALLDEALEKLVDFELPKTLLDAETDTKIKLKMQPGKKEPSKTEREAMEKEALKEAKVALKLFFILQKIANDNDIIVTEQELRDTLSERLAQLNLPPQLSSNQKYKNQLIQEMRMNCFIDLLTDKVRRHLLAQVSVG